MCGKASPRSAGEVPGGRRGSWASVEAPVHISSMKRFENGLEDIIHPSQHVAIPESQDAKPMGPEECISMLVTRSLIEVLAPIQLDNDCGFKADEIADIHAERMLPSEFEATQLSASQASPETPFSLRLIRTQLAGEMDHTRRRSARSGENITYIQL